MDTVMILVGVLIGGLLGLLLTWILLRHGKGAEPFFQKLLQQENRADARIDTRLMLHELLRKVEDLTVKTHRMDMELQELRNRPLQQVQVVGGEPHKKNPSLEVCRLSREGLSASEIASHLQLGQGEVELLLSLEKRPHWVVSGGK